MRNFTTILAAAKKPLLLFACLLCSLASSAYSFEVDGIYYDILSTTDLTVEVVKGDTEYTGDIVIPETVTYRNKKFTVVAVGERALYQNFGLVSLTLPETVKDIKEVAVFFCRALVSVQADGVENVGGQCFRGCTSLKEISLPSAKSIEYCGFKGCTALEKVNLPSANYLHWDCFANCTSLKEISLPSIETIEYGCFRECTSLEKVTLGKNLTKFGQSGKDGVFANCDKITEVWSHILTPSDINEEEFYLFTYDDATLYVPVGTKSLYQACTGWKNFLKIVESAECGTASEPTGISSATAESESAAVYTLQGVSVGSKANAAQQLPAGIYIVGGKKIVVK